jgi:3-dehydroquinate synthase
MICTRVWTPDGPDKGSNGVFVKEFSTQRRTRTEYIVGIGAFTSEGVLRRLRATESVLLIDEQVELLNAREIAEFEAGLTSLGRLTLPGAEATKSLACLDEILSFADGVGLPKHGQIIAVGGGTVCDVAGVAAMSFRRGVSLVLVPTTLLAQIDAAVGGKNGLNYEASKNLVGHFYHPELVCCDPRFFATLNERELICGFAEAVKVLAVSDARAFSRYFARLPAELSMVSAEAWTALVRDALSWKLALLEEDPYEESSRRLLNYGHAFAHFFEESSDHALAHGEAVLIGMIIENEISRALHIGTDNAIRDLQVVTARYLTQACRSHWMTFPSVQPHLDRLRRARRGRMNFVCIENPGTATIVDDVDNGTLEEAWRQAERVVRHSGHRVPAWL